MPNDTPPALPLEAENEELRARVAELEERLAGRETALLGSQQMLRLIIDNMPLAIFWKDQNLTYLGCNRAFAHSAGFDSPDEIVGKTDDDMPWRVYADQYRAVDRQVIETGVARYNFEEPIQNVDGVVGWARTSKVPLYDQDNTPIAVLGLYEDITARKQTEMELRTFQALAEAAPDGIGVASPQGVLTYANAMFGEMMGYGEALIGMRLPTLHVEDERQIAGLMEHVTIHGQWRGVLHYRRKDGRIFPSQASIFPIRDAEGQPQAFAAIVRDLTEQQRAEQERQALQEQVIAAQQAALRELSTPLMPIAEGVVVMPIVGSIDSTRAQQVMETLLQGVADQRADVAIIDITGVKVVDTQVASALLTAAQAVQLLGARVVLTGISPEVAQTLVHLAADLRSIITRSNLQSGIAFALAQRQNGGGQ